MKLEKKLLAHKEEAALMATSGAKGGVLWTPGDLLAFNAPTFLLYHVMESGYAFLTPLGCVVGAAVLPKLSPYSHLTTLQAAGAGGLLAGQAGAGLGLVSLVAMRSKKDPQIPWDMDGMQTRVQGLQHNPRVRAMDLGCWMGLAAAAGCLYYKQPESMGLSAGLPGQWQALALGSAVGSVSGNLWAAFFG